MMMMMMIIIIIIKELPKIAVFGTALHTHVLRKVLM